MEAELTDADVADLQASSPRSPTARSRRASQTAADVRREHGFVVGLGDDSAPLLNGIIDVLAFEDGGGALVVDYKSDVVTPDADLEALCRGRLRRTATHLRARRAGAGAADVEVAHLFLARPAEPATVVYDRNDLPRLREELDGLVARHRRRSLLADHRSPTGRSASPAPAAARCARHPEELTLRDEPTPVV